MTLPAEAAPRDPGVAGKILIAIGKVLVFVLLGPLVGGIVTIVGLVAFGMDLAKPGDAGMVIAAMMLYGLWMAYPIGALPAAIVGAVIGFADVFWRETTFSFAVLLGLATGVGWALLFGEAEQELLRILVLASCLVATVLCWKATRWGRRA
jgi:hypothetical protein